MSAPETKLREQEKHHRAPLLGLRAVVLYALILLALVAIVVFVRGNDPGDEEGADAVAPAAAAEDDV